MSDELVDRLRNEAAYDAWNMGEGEESVARDAADEIERLRAQNERLKARGIEDMQHEIGRLRDIVWMDGQAPIDQWFGTCHFCQAQIEKNGETTLDHDPPCPWLEEHNRRNPQ